MWGGGGVRMGGWGRGRAQHDAECMKRELGFDLLERDLWGLSIVGRDRQQISSSGDPQGQISDGGVGAVWVGTASPA